MLIFYERAKKPFTASFSNCFFHIIFNTTSPLYSSTEFDFSYETLGGTLRNTHIILLVIFAAVWLFAADSPHSALTLVAITLHELGHIIGALFIGENFNSFGLQIGGLLLSRKKVYTSYFSEAFIAFCGPLFNFISAAICFILFRQRGDIFFTEVSLALGLLNMLPIKEFDGGKVAEALLSAFIPCTQLYYICEMLSFLSLFFLWSTSVYALLKSGESITLFLFSAVLFVRMFLSQRKS